jgi:tRNA(fMet)-specific endonuclease VapC
VFFLRGKYGVDEAIRERGVENCCVSEITVAELRYGAENSGDPERHHQLVDTFLEWVETLSIASGILVYAEEKVRFKRMGVPHHDEFDLLIGASAVSEDLVLVTDNLKDFERFAGIQVENWVRR